MKVERRKSVVANLVRDITKKVETLDNIEQKIDAVEKKNPKLRGLIDITAGVVILLLFVFVLYLLQSTDSQSCLTGEVIEKCLNQ